MARAMHKRRRRVHLPDPAVPNQLDAALDAGPHERIGRTAQQQFLLCRQCRQRLAVGQRGGQGFFIVHMFAGVQGRLRHGSMRLRGGQVQHQFDGVIGQQVFHAAGPRNSVLFGTLSCTGHIQIRTGRQLQDVHIRQPFEIGM